MADVVNEVPTDARPVNGAVAPATVSFRPVRFNLVSLWESPCTWVLVGAVGTLAVLYMMQRFERRNK